MTFLVDSGSMRIAYLECFSGISGDMFLGALIDAGVSPELLQQTVKALNVDATLTFSRVSRSGITATKADVIVNGEPDLPREVFQQRHAHEHEHSHHHGHEHSQHTDHKHDTHGHQHGRSLKDIRRLISDADLSATAKQRAIAIFETLGRAEAKIHNTDLESIHFHEVGSTDAIVDIVCAAVGSEALGVERWICSPLNVGGGTVVCSHGTLPVPAPATVELLQSRNAPVYSSGIQKELVTPTGAAIVSVLASSFGSFPAMMVERAGFGAGYRDLPGHANVLRLTVGEPDSVVSSLESPGSHNLQDCNLPVETVSVLEATLDDMTPQLFGYVLEKAIESGALDAYVIPVQMKKNRPGMLLTVLTRPEDRQRIARLLFTETTTIGLRVRDEQRYVLPRRQVSVTTPWGEVRVKAATLDGVVVNCLPEYEDCRRIASEHHISLKSVMQRVTSIYLQSSDKKS